MCPSFSKAAALEALLDCIWLGHRSACLTHCVFVSDPEEPDLGAKVIPPSPFLSFSVVILRLKKNLNTEEFQRT